MRLLDIVEIVCGAVLLLSFTYLKVDLRRIKDLIEKKRVKLIYSQHAIDRLSWENGKQAAMEKRTRQLGTIFKIYDKFMLLSILDLCFVIGASISSCLNFMVMFFLMWIIGVAIQWKIATNYWYGKEESKFND